MCSVTEIALGAFQNCSSMISLSLPKTIQFVCSSAFADCGNLESVTMEENGGTYEVVLDSYVFSECVKLKTVKLSEDVGELRYYLFLNCKSLDNLKLLENVKYLGECMIKGMKIASIIIEYIVLWTREDRIYYTKVNQ